MSNIERDEVVAIEWEFQNNELRDKTVFGKDQVKE